MKKELNIAANLILLLVLDITIMVLGFEIYQGQANDTDIMVLIAAIVVGIYFVRDTYKLLRPTFRRGFATTAPNIEDVSDEYYDDYEDFLGEDEY